MTNIFNEINITMRIHEILLEKKLKKLSKKHIDLDDVEDKPEDPEMDKIPHVVMQLRKALDVDGDYPITFKDGKKAKLQIDQIKQFLKKYSELKPDERSRMQDMASANIEGFHKALNFKGSEPIKSAIKGNRYMSHFAGDDDNK